MAKELDILGILFMVEGLLILVFGLFFGVMYLVIGGGVGGMFTVLGAVGGDGELFVAGLVNLVIFVLIGGGAILLAACVCLPPVIVGRGIRARAPWSRVAGIVLAALSLTVMPLGTLIGIFGLVTLLNGKTAAEFEGIVRG